MRTQAFQKELRCAICINTFIEPVTLECGHSFCRPCLCLSWEETQIPARCPVCRGPCQQRDLKTNVVLRSLVAIARRASLRHFLSSEEYMCGTHRETKQMFCEVDRALLCRSCSQSQEHRAHKHHPIDRAAEEQREMISKQMHAVWEKTQQNQHNLQEKRRLINRWIWYVKLFRGITKDVFRNMYQELIKTYQKPDVELLQDVELILESCESVLFFLPLPLRPELSAPPIPGLIERLTQHRVEIAFNDATENHDLGCCVGQDNPYAVLSSEESFHFTAFGHQVFSSGKHYWEVSVDDSSTWALGVIRDFSIGSNLTESEDLFLLLFVKENTLSTIFTTSPLLPHYVEKPLGRVGVFLDLDDGSESFWNVAKSSLIWRYPTGAVQFPVRPHFFSGSLVS
ncbi:tripartite motif-containing protein 43-like [Dipodomys spectabilis]|uniref:tripartite motif-containing protein 43-like n=1 Tax=Dipodomys spectabilis TaxID=105255 RepID=UPI001C53903D|nr:tripartite motif-containing protein 43-like [Dipodomys spectabilis]